MNDSSRRGIATAAKTASGWLVAVALATYALSLAPGGEKHVAQDEGNATDGAEAAPRRDAKARPSASAKEERAEAKAETPVAVYDPVPGNDWTPPGEIESIGGILAMSAGLGPADRDLAERIKAAAESLSTADALELAREAAGSKESKVRLLAVRMLEACLSNETGTGTEDARLSLIDALLEFCGDRNPSVSSAAAKCASSGADKIDTPAEYLSRLERFANACAKSDEMHLWSSRAVRNLGPGDAAKWMEETARIFKSDTDFSGWAGYKRSNALRNVAESVTGIRDNQKVDKLLRNPDELAAWIARRNELEAIAAGKNDDPRFVTQWANRYVKMESEAAARFGDADCDAARQWLSDEMEVAAADIGTALSQSGGDISYHGSFSSPDNSLSFKNDSLLKSIRIGENSYMFTEGF